MNGGRSTKLEDLDEGSEYGGESLQYSPEINYKQDNQDLEKQIYEPDFTEKIKFFLLSEIKDILGMLLVIVITNLSYTNFLLSLIPGLSSEITILSIKGVIGLFIYTLLKKI